MDYTEIIPPKKGQTLFLLGTVHKWGKEEYRTYEIKIPQDKWGYHSSTSGGELFWTTEKQGRNEEPLIDYRRYIIVDGQAFLSSAKDWKEVLSFFKMIRFKLESFEYSKVSRKGGK